jgi:hypothetical protein
MDPLFENYIAFFIIKTELKQKKTEQQFFHLFINFIQNYYAKEIPIYYTCLYVPKSGEISLCGGGTPGEKVSKKLFDNYKRIEEKRVQTIRDNIILLKNQGIDTDNRSILGIPNIWNKLDSEVYNSLSKKFDFTNIEYNDITFEKPFLSDIDLNFVPLKISFYDKKNILKQSDFRNKVSQRLKNRNTLKQFSIINSQIYTDLHDDVHEHHDDDEKKLNILKNKLLDMSKELENEEW